MPVVQQSQPLYTPLTRTATTKVGYRVYKGGMIDFTHTFKAHYPDGEIVHHTGGSEFWSGVNSFGHTVALFKPFPFQAGVYQEFHLVPSEGMSFQFSAVDLIRMIEEKDKATVQPNGELYEKLFQLAHAK